MIKSGGAELAEPQVTRVCHARGLLRWRLDAKGTYLLCNTSFNYETKYLGFSVLTKDFD